MYLCTLGYNRWQPICRLANIVRVLTENKITTLVDIRQSPCPSNLDPRSNYGPRDWHLLDGEAGLDGHLKRCGIEYVWLGELGNPQRHDRDMKILRSHLADVDHPWPANRGLALLHKLVKTKGNLCCLLCACKEYDRCHRKIVAQTLDARYFGGKLEINDLNR